jgi:hypothetical protein
MATRAMSSGWPTRPSGVLAIICFLNSVPMTPAACVPSVSVPPGLRALTRIFLGPNSFESTRVKPLTALFVKFLLAELLEVRKREDARVVHEHIQACASDLCATSPCTTMARPPLPVISRATRSALS